MTRTEFIQYIEQTFAECLQLVKDKNSDYAGDVPDPFANFSAVGSLGICSVETGVMVRMTDKFRRTVSLLAKGSSEVKTESIHDTLKDLANYSIILSAYIHSKDQNNETREERSGDLPANDATESSILPPKVV